MDYLPKNFEKRTRRLVIRPYKSSDHSAWKQSFSQISTSELEYEKRIKKSKNDLTKEKFKQIVNCQKEHRDNDTFYDFAIFRKNSGELIGFTNIMGVLRSGWQKADLGYLLFSSHWGKGYAQEMVKATIGIAFDNLKLHRLEASILRPRTFGYFGY